MDQASRVSLVLDVAVILAQLCPPTFQVVMVSGISGADGKVREKGVYPMSW